MHLAARRIPLLGRILFPGFRRQRIDQRAEEGYAGCSWARQDRGVCFLGDKAGSLKKSLDSLKCPGLKA